MPGACRVSTSAPSRGPPDDCRSVGYAHVPRVSREARNGRNLSSESRVAELVERPLAGDATGERCQACLPINWSTWTRCMRWLLPAVVLVGMAFLVAELLPGSAPITQPLLWPFLLLIYGPGALLIRESARRLDCGWGSILLLGTAYGLVEEGLALQSLFNPSLYGAADWGARIAGIKAFNARPPSQFTRSGAQPCRSCSRICCFPITATRLTWDGWDSS